MSAIFGRFSEVWHRSPQSIVYIQYPEAEDSEQAHSPLFVQLEIPHVGDRHHQDDEIGERVDGRGYGLRR